MIVGCASKGCLRTAVGKSKYCAEHKQVARERWLATVQRTSADRQERIARFEEVWRKACAAGIAAGKGITPEPMTVVQRAHPMDDNSPVVQTYHVPEGMCGFAWVTVRPGNSSFARWLVKSDHARSAYDGGVQVWIHDHNQSVARKEAHAQAMADVLRAEFPELRIYAGSRLD